MSGNLYLSTLVQRAEALVLKPTAVPTTSPPTAVLLPPADDADDTEPALQLLPLRSQEQDYTYRGDRLRAWPLYFYVATVSRISALKARGDVMVAPFATGHPDCRGFVQRIALQQAWCVPHLVGRTIPAADKDPELRALILLLLFKPWTSLGTLRLPSGQPDRPPWTSWVAALEDFTSVLLEEAGDPHPRPIPFTRRYWAHRSLAAQTCHMSTPALCFPSPEVR